MAARPLLASLGVHALLLGAGSWFVMVPAPCRAPRTGWLQLDATPIAIEAEPTVSLTVEADAPEVAAASECEDANPEDVEADRQPWSDTTPVPPPAAEGPAVLAHADGSLRQLAVSRASTASAPPAPRPQPQVVAAVAAELNLPPVYPAEALREGRSGTVLLEVTVETDGAVSMVRVHASSGSADLDAAALSALRAWRFHPATEDGVAIRSRLVQPVEFRIARPPAGRP